MQWSRYRFNIYNHEKDHTLLDVVEMPDSRIPENFNRLLTFLQNVRMSELGGLAHCHLNSYHPLNENSEYYLAAKFAVASMNSKKDEMASTKKNYERLFPKGKFSSMINPPEQSNKSKNKKSK